MAEEERPVLGLSIGATNLAAVTADHAITRKPVLTLYRQRPPEVGVPSENHRLDEPGLVINDFVDRIGDPAATVASDGSVHRSEALAADGLRALAYVATGGRPLPGTVAVTYPAHWRPRAVDALGSALRRVAEWSNEALTLIPDAAATLYAVRANPGLPARGIIAVCDFGGSGTSITLVDAAGEYEPVAPTLRYPDFSGDVIDQALLTSVMAELPSRSWFDPADSPAIGSVARLRGSCRSAKERLSASAETTLAEDLSGLGADIRITRNELGDTIRDLVKKFLTVLDQTLARNGVRFSDLTTVVSVGGGANISLVTTMLSGHLGVPVVTTPRPQLTAPIGGALRALDLLADPTSTRSAQAEPAVASAKALQSLAVPAATTSRTATSRTSGAVALAEGPLPDAFESLEQRGIGQVATLATLARPESKLAPISTGGGYSAYSAARPALTFEREDQPSAKRSKSVLLAVGTALTVLLASVGLVVWLNYGEQTAAPGVSTTSRPSAPSAPTSVAPPISETAQPTPVSETPGVDQPIPAIQLVMPEGQGAS